MAVKCRDKTVNRRTRAVQAAQLSNVIDASIAEFPVNPRIFDECYVKEQASGAWHPTGRDRPLLLLS
jgi:hypothetical protein